jgi:hypothetical protein
MSPAEGSEVTGRRFYITTAIDYANGDPHLGHAFEKIGADAIARYRRLWGDDVEFLMGMDEHGQKVAQTAAAESLEPQQLADRVAVSFQRIWERLGISHDQFIRTTDERHKRGVRALIERIFDRNPDDFYERAYEGWYCVGASSSSERRRSKMGAASSTLPAISSGPRSETGSSASPATNRFSRPTSRITRAFSSPRAGVTRSWPCWKAGSKTSPSAARVSSGPSPSPARRVPARSRERGSGSMRCPTT